MSFVLEIQQEELTSIQRAEQDLTLIYGVIMQRLKIYQILLQELIPLPLRMPTAVQQH